MNILELENVIHFLRFPIPRHISTKLLQKFQPTFRFYYFTKFYCAKGFGISLRGIFSLRIAV